jgi:hypothetical protein
MYNAGAFLFENASQTPASDRPGKVAAGEYDGVCSQSSRLSSELPVVEEDKEHAHVVRAETLNHREDVPLYSPEELPVRTDGDAPYWFWHESTYRESKG